MSNPTGIADPNSSWSYSTIDKAVYTMIPNTSTQSQDLFKDCLGFARQLSQSPRVYCKLEVKLGENSFKFETGNPGKFPDKRKSPSDFRRDQRRKNPPGKEMPAPGNQGVSSAALGDPTRALKGVTSRAPPSSLHAVERYPGQNIYSLLKIYPSWMAMKVLALKKSYISKHQPQLLRPWSNMSGNVASSHLLPRYNQPYPQPTHNLWITNLFPPCCSEIWV